MTRIPQVIKGEKGIASAENIKNEGPALCQLRMRGCGPFTRLPDSSVKRHAHVCPVPLAVTGLAGGGGVVGAGPPCLRHTCSC